MRRLPPLNALRAFEAAARHLSFTRAAEELSVTQAAVSHQVKALEERLGVALFRRVHRGLLLTEAGQRLLPVLTQAFDRIAMVTAQLDAVPSRTLRITVVPSFAARWLVPRLHRFQQAHPDITVHLQAEDRVVDLALENIDCGIRYGRGDYPGLEVEALMQDDVFPVCAPALVTGEHPLRTPDDLRHHVLVHDDYAMDWRMWLTTAGVEGVDPDQGPAFDRTDMLLDYVAEGRGVALGRTTLVADDLARGRLVKPFELSLPSDYAYYLACRPDVMHQPRFVAFRDWLLEEAGADR